MALIKSFQFLRDEADRAFERQFISKDDKAREEITDTVSELKKDETSKIAEQKQFVAKVQTKQKLSENKVDEQAQIQPGRYKLPDGSWVTLGKAVNVSKKQNLGFDPAVLEDLKFRAQQNDINLKRVGAEVTETRKEVSQIRKEIKNQTDSEFKNTADLIDYQKTEATKNLEKLNKEIDKRNKQKAQEDNAKAKTKSEQKINKNPYESGEHDIEEDKEKALGYEKKARFDEVNESLSKIKNSFSSIKKHGLLGSAWRDMKMSGITSARNFLREQDEKRQAQQRLLEYGNLSPIERFQVSPMSIFRRRPSEDKTPLGADSVKTTSPEMTPLGGVSRRQESSNEGAIQPDLFRRRQQRTPADISRSDKTKNLTGVKEKASATSLMKGGKSRSMLAGSAKSIGKTKGALQATKQMAKTGGKGLFKGLLKKIPIVGAAIGLASGIGRLMEGDIAGAGMEIASGVVSTVPGFGTAASVGIDAALAARDTVRARDAAAQEEENARKGVKPRKFAKGGVITQPTKLTAPGLSGEMGEAGPEAIVPIKPDGTVKSDSNVKISPDTKQNTAPAPQAPSPAPTIINNSASSGAPKPSAKESFGGRLSEDLFIFNDVNIQR